MNPLHDILTVNIFQFTLLFARIGTTFMLLPGFSSSTVFPRTRLIIALFLAVLLVPSLGSHLPPMPADPLALTLMLIGETAIGAFLGMVAQILLTPMDFAGSSIGYAVGLTNMFTFDPITEQQSQLVTGFLNLTAMTMVFVTDAHHLMIRALVDSYALFVPGQRLMVEDFSRHLVQILGASCLMGLRLAAPLMVFSLAFNTGLGLMNKLVPQIPVFFVGLPIQIVGGLSILALSLPAILWAVISYFQAGLAFFIGDN